MLQAAPASANSALWPTGNLAAAPVLAVAGADPVAAGVVPEVWVAEPLSAVRGELEDALPVLLGAAIAAVPPSLNRLAPSTTEAVKNP